MYSQTPLPSFQTGFARYAHESDRQDLWKSLCALYYPGLGRQGNRLFDLSGCYNNGTFTNIDAGTDWLGGAPLGLGVNFGGGTDVIDCGANAVLPTAPPFTLYAIATVASQDTTNYPRYISRLSGSPFNGWELLLGKTNDVNHPSKFYLQCGNGGTLSSVDTVTAATTGNTYRILTTLDAAGNGTIWLDGKLERSGSLGGSPVGTPGVNMYLGKWPGGSNSSHNGLFHFAAVWKRVLSVDEIRDVSFDPVGLLRIKPMRAAKRIAASFNPAWAKRTNVLIQAGMV